MSGLQYPSFSYGTSPVSGNTALTKRPHSGVIEQCRSSKRTRMDTPCRTRQTQNIDSFPLPGDIWSLSPEQALTQGYLATQPKEQQSDSNANYSKTWYDEAPSGDDKNDCPALDHDGHSPSISTYSPEATQTPSSDTSHYPRTIPLQPFSEQINYHGDTHDRAQRSIVDSRPWPYGNQPNWSTFVTGSISFTDHLLSTGFLCSLGQLEPQAPPGPVVPLQGFLKPLPDNIGPDEAALLRSKGALSLPRQSLQNALLETFVDHIYPHLPIVNLIDLLFSVQSWDGSEGQVSLLLYQAIMFAASTFVNEDYLHQAGFTSRKEAQEVFYRRTRCLYDFDYETDRVTVVQVLLLLTYWHGTDNEQKDCWYWMGAAISLAQSINLHLSSPCPADLRSSSSRNLRKRLWWSCFVQERLMALGTKRPTRIQDDCCDIPMLSIKDFEAEVLPKEITILSHKSKVIRAIKLQEDLANIFISKAQLCLCMSDLLQPPSHYLTQSPNTPSSIDLLDSDKIQELDQKLLAWEESLPLSCQYRTITQLDLQNGRSPIVVQRTLLHMLYYSTVSLLHRAQSLPFSFTNLAVGSSSVQHMSRLRVRESVMRITRMAEELYHFALVRLLPSTSVATILSAVVMHILEMRDQDQGSSSHNRTLKWFRQCMRVLDDLSQIHPNAEDANRYLNRMLDKTSLGVEILTELQERMMVA